MKTMILFLSVFFSAQSFAAYKTIDVGQSANLSDCGGYLSTTLNSNDQVVLNFSNVENCSNFDITKSDGGFVGEYTAKKLQGQNPNRYGNFTIPVRLMGDYSVTVLLRSNSGKTSDTIKIRLSGQYDQPASASHTLRVGDYLALNYDVCGGSVEVNNGGNNSQINVVFRNVKYCSNFDIIKADGSYVGNYRSKKIPGSNNNYTGSFTIPNALLGNLWSNVTVLIKNSAGTRVETVKVKYFRW
jgi:hypothetical protein